MLSLWEEAPRKCLLQMLCIYIDAHCTSMSEVKNPTIGGARLEGGGDRGGRGGDHLGRAGRLRGADRGHPPVRGQLPALLPLLPHRLRHRHHLLRHRPRQG